MTDAAIDVLKRVPLFADLDAAELQLFGGPMRKRTFRAGETVTAEGAGGDGFFVVDAGEAQVAVQGEVLGSIGPGDCFGEIALLMGSERTATITAVTDLDCYGLTAAEFSAVVEGNPTIAWKLMQSMTDRLS
jgi:CRP-like cAMP-binding protein